MKDSTPHKLRIYFSDYFDIAPSVLAKFGAFNVSLINDLPLFIDPFLLFNSNKRQYRELHDKILGYMIFLRDRSAKGPLSDGLIKAWFMFPEVKQTWLGFSRVGNAGAGLGLKFARSLHENLTTHFSDGTVAYRPRWTRSNRPPATCCARMLFVV